MDASSSLALGALNVVADQQAQAAMAQLLLDHERSRMRAEDELAQRDRLIERAEQELENRDLEMLGAARAITRMMEPFIDRQGQGEGE